MKKTITMIMIIFVVIIINTTNLKANYNYSPWQESIESAHSMSIRQRIDNSNLVDENGNEVNVIFDDLRDSFVYENKLYVVDSKTNLIYILNENYQYVESLPKENDIKLKEPKGIFIIDDKLYVADTENNRIVIISLITKEHIQIIETPEDDLFDNIKFRPEKIVVDRTGRILVVARDVFEGIMEFDSNGKFARFFGTNTVTMNLIEALIYRFSTKKQRDKMALKLQTNFTNIDIDSYGYIYTVSRNESVNPVKKLNFKGNNILINNGYINILGDQEYIERSERVTIGPSSISDITVNDDDLRYSILDSKRGRIFTYDLEGHLLYIFGGLGSQTNMLQGPTSITYFNEDVIVTDNVTKSIMVFTPTKFGELINLATKSYYEMDYDNSLLYWEQVISENSNYFLAYAGIGKTQLRNLDYEDAITNLKLGHDYYNYSKAYEQYRNQKMKTFLPYVIVVVFIFSGYGFYKSIKGAIKREEDE